MSTVGTMSTVGIMSTVGHYIEIITERGPAMKKVLVVDGQGGRFGNAIISRIIEAKISCNLVAVGTNSVATAAMIKAGAELSATGENPVIFNARDADVIMGPMGIIAANSFLGELSPAMSLAISQSGALKILIPVNKCNIYVPGVEEETLTQLLDGAVAKLKSVI